MQGTGNDFVIFNTFSHPLSLSCEQIKHIADRRLGIGCDQVLLLGPPKNNETDNNFKVTTVALNNFGKLVIIKSKSIKIPCYNFFLICLKTSCL